MKGSIWRLKGVDHKLPLCQSPGPAVGLQCVQDTESFCSLGACFQESERCFRFIQTPRIV